MNILDVKNLSIYFEQDKVVNELNFKLEKNKALGIVGESGSGKSLTSLAILGLLPFIGARIADESQILFNDNNTIVDITKIQSENLRKIRGNNIAMIFQEPMTSLNPLFTVENQILESINLHQNLGKEESKKEMLNILNQVKLPRIKNLVKQYPHELSGGMRQRVMIAMALSCKPKILIADEPTTALDVTTQHEVLKLIKQLQKDIGLSIIFISHDMGVISQISDEIIVMNKGEIVEHNTKDIVFNNPSKVYTKKLLSSIPEIGSMHDKQTPYYFNIIKDKDEILPTIDYTSKKELLLEVDNLTKVFKSNRGLFRNKNNDVIAVNNANFKLYKGETLALVGESSSGKSTIGRMIQSIITKSSGKIIFNKTDTSTLGKSDTKLLKKDIQYIFQDPFASLNPRKKIGESILEPMIVHNICPNKNEAKNVVLGLLERVGLDKSHYDRFPHEFSGGQRQRICIARALSCKPKLIIADEVVSALDVSIQADILNLLIKLQVEEGLSFLFITHDMAVVEQFSHRVIVLHDGNIVEVGNREEIFDSPFHPYTQKLILSVPSTKDVSSYMKRVENSKINEQTKYKTINGFIEISDTHYVNKDFSL